MHIYLDKESQEKLKRLAKSGIYKKNTASYVLKYLIEKEEKYTENVLKEIERKKEQERVVIEKFGSIENAVELAQLDWVNE